MDRQFDVEDVAAAAPGWVVLVGRGLGRRCPRCGCRAVFTTRWRLADRCPGCGYRFRREPGFFLGAWFINFMVLEAVHWSMAMAFIIWKSGHPEAPILWSLVVLVISGTLLPVWFYPHSQTIWAGIDLAMTPLELAEIVDAVDSTKPSPGPESEPEPGVDRRSP